MRQLYLSELSSERFTVHWDRKIVFLKMIAFILGPNASGKTSLKDAFEWLLTGVCRSTDAGGRGYESLISTGAEGMCVSAVVAGQRATRDANRKGTEFTVEGWQGNRKTLEAEFLKKITGGKGLTRGQLHALLNSTGFFALRPAEQCEMFFATLGLDFGKDDIYDLLGKIVAHDGDGKPTPFTRALAGILEPIPETKRGAKLLEAIHDAGFAERREAKRALKALEDQADDRPDAELPDGIETGDLKDAQAQLADLRKKRDAALAKRHAIEGTHQRRVALDAEIAELQTKHEELEAQVADLTRMAKALAAPDLGDMRARIEAKREEVSKVEKELAVASAQLERLTALVARFEASPGQCVVDAEFPCSLTAKGTSLFEQLHSALAATQESKMTLEGARAVAVKSLAAMGEDLAAKESVLRQKAGLESKIAAVTARREEVADQIERKGHELTQFLKAEQAVPEVLVAEIEGLEKRIAKGETFVEGLARREEVEKHIKARAAALEHARRRVEVFEDLVATFGPDGLPKSLLSDRKEALLAPIVAAVASLTAGEYQVSFDDNLAIRVTHGGKDLPVESLSDSEMLRIGVAVQVGIAKALSFPLVVVDKVDTLYGENRATFTDGARCIAEDGLQVLILASGETPAQRADRLEEAYEGATIPEAVLREIMELREQMNDPTVQYIQLRGQAVEAGV